MIDRGFTLAATGQQLGVGYTTRPPMCAPGLSNDGKWFGAEVWWRNPDRPAKTAVDDSINPSTLGILTDGPATVVNALSYGAFPFLFLGVGSLHHPGQTRVNIARLWRPRGYIDILWLPARMKAWFRPKQTAPWGLNRKHNRRSHSFKGQECGRGAGSH